MDEWIILQNDHIEEKEAYHSPHTAKPNPFQKSKYKEKKHKTGIDKDILVIRAGKI